MKSLSTLIVFSIAAAGLATAGEARPHHPMMRKHCSTVWVHHHKIRRCH